MARLRLQGTLTSKQPSSLKIFPVPSPSYFLTLRSSQLRIWDRNTTQIPSSLKIHAYRSSILPSALSLVAIRSSRLPSYVSLYTSVVKASSIRVRGAFSARLASYLRIASFFPGTFGRVRFGEAETGSAASSRAWPIRSFLRLKGYVFQRIPSRVRLGVLRNLPIPSSLNLSGQVAVFQPSSLRIQGDKTSMISSSMRLAQGRTLRLSSHVYLVGSDPRTSVNQEPIVKVSWRID